MSWIAITKDTLYEAKIAVVIDLCDTLLKADGQADRAAGIIQGVVDEIRRKVASCRGNRVDSDLTKIPKGLRDMAVDLIVARLKKAIDDPLSEDERTAVATHQANLNRIAECKDTVDQPDAPITAPVEAGGGSQIVNAPGGINRQSLAGL